MPQKPNTQSDFSGGLWITPPNEKAPDNTTPQNTGVGRFNVSHIRSRNGSTVISTRDAHTIRRFIDTLALGVGTELYIDNTLALTGLSGARLATLIASPTPGKPRQLYIAGGGLSKKITEAGVASDIGIDPFPDGFTAALEATTTKSIEAFDSFTDWTTNGNFSVFTNEAGIKKEGVSSLKTGIVANSEGRFWQNFGAPIDLTTYGATASSDEDYIRLWILLSNPQSVRSIELLFSVTAGGFDGSGIINEAYSYIVEPADDEGLFRSDTRGIASFEDEVTIRDERIVRLNTSNNALLEPLPPGTDFIPIPKFNIGSSDRELLARKRHQAVVSFGTKTATWTQLRIPKILFNLTHESTGDWSAIHGVGIYFKTNDDPTGPFAYFDQLDLAGSRPLVGSYRLHITARNSVTGEESSPNPTHVLVEGADRQGIDLSGLPLTHPNPDVDTTVIYRTVGDGKLFFEDSTVPLGTATAKIIKPDFPGMSDTGTDFLSGDELQRHTPPEATYNDIVGLHIGRAWYGRDSAVGAEGRAYYSRPGLPGSIEGFLHVAQAGDEYQKGVIWAARLWILTSNHIYEILGSAPPYLARAVTGAEGTLFPHSVVATGAGIIYEGQDGLRLFDGVSSKPFAAAPIQLIFRGERHNNIGPLSNLIMSVGGGEVIISDGTTTLILDEQSKWRDYGIGASALFYDRERRTHLATMNNKVLSMDDPSATLDGDVAIPLTIQTHPFLTDMRQETSITGVTVDLDTQGQSVTVTLNVDDKTVNLGTLNTSSRKAIDLDGCATGRIFSLTFTASLTARVSIYAAELRFP